jgi:hypothetical protein
VVGVEVTKLLLAAVDLSVQVVDKRDRLGRKGSEVAHGRPKVSSVARTRLLSAPR